MTVKTIGDVDLTGDVDAFGNINASGGTITGTLVVTAAPVGNTDATNKLYVDTLVSGVASGFSVKGATLAASTAAYVATYNNGVAGVGATLTNAAALVAFDIDGYSPALNGRVLIKDQVLPEENGIYTVTTVGSGVVAWVLTRAGDFDQAADVSSGSLTYVINGATNFNQQFAVNSPGPFTIGTTPITWTQILTGANITSVNGQTGPAVVLTNSDIGLSNVVNVDQTNASNLTSGTVANARLPATLTSAVASTGTVTGTNLSGTNTGDQTITLTNDVTGSGTGSFAATISNNAVTTVKVANSNITYSKIQNVTANQLLGNPAGVAGSPVEIPLGAGLSFSGGALVATGGSGTVTSVSVTAQNGVSAIVSNPTTTPALAFTLGAITPSSIASTGTITGTNLTGTNTGDQTITLTGDVTGSGTGSFAATIANNAVTTVKINNSNVTYAKIQNVTANQLLGNPTGITGAPVEIPLGFGLSFSGGALTATGGTGTVTSVSVTTANGVSGSVATATTTPAISLTLGAITPSSVAASGAVSGSNLSGTNTGDQTITLTGDVTGSGTSGFPTLISNNVVNYGKIQQAGASTLLGNPTGSLANVSQITLGAGLSFAGSTLTATGSGGTVTNVSVVNANGISGSVSNPSTTPALTLSLGAITPTTVNGIAFTLGTGTPNLTVNGATSVAGSNTGDQLITLTGDVTGTGTGSFAATIANNAVTTSKINNAAVTYAKIQNVANARLLGNNSGGAAALSEIALDSSLAFSGASTLQRAALTGDISAPSGSNATTLATVNSNVGSFTNANVTVNAKGLITAASSGSSTPTNSWAYGRGGDGAAVFDGVNAVTGASRSGTVYTLLRNVFYTNATVSTGVIIKAVGLRMFCSGTLTLTGTARIHNDGNGSNGAPDVNLGKGTNAGAPNNNGVNNTNALGGAGGNSGGGKTGGGITAPTMDSDTAFNYFPSVLTGSNPAGILLNGGAGGGSDAAGNTGGGGGGVNIIAANIISGSGSVTANGATANGSGGGGGGGAAILIYNTKSSWTGTVTANGGSGPGTGSDGIAGIAFDFQI